MRSVVGLGLLVLLATAVWLSPDDRGRGTHEQLGLPPCTFLSMFGIPCPSCGMTTSWAHTVRGQIPSAARANLGGTGLALLALVATPWLLLTAVSGRPVRRIREDQILVVTAVTLAVVTAIDWVVRVTAS